MSGPWQTSIILKLTYIGKQLGYRRAVYGASSTGNTHTYIYMHLIDIGYQHFNYCEI